MHDGQLLRDFVERGSQAAFSRIVSRHLGLVYSACRREIGEATLAEDATQAVFLLLARKAPSLRREPSLAGWLFQAARLVSKDAVKQEGRRRRREQEAARDMTREDRGNALWDEIEPFLDDALAALGRTEREAVLLRLFEGHSLAETGAALGLSEEAARKRVSRALDKVRHRLQAVGVIVSAAALAALLSEKSVQAAPPTCAAAVALFTSTLTPGAATLGTAGVQVTRLTQGAMKAMTLTKLKTATLIAFGLGSLSGGTYLAYAKQETGSAITGRIRYADGRPAPGIMISARVQSRDAALIAAGRHSGFGVPAGQEADATSGADGSYWLTGLKGVHYTVIELAGYSVLSRNNPTEWVAAAVPVKAPPTGEVRVPDLILTHGAVITGTVVNTAGKALPDVYVYSLGPRYPASMNGSSSVQADSHGHFSLRVAPGDNWIYVSGGGYQTEATSTSPVNAPNKEHGFHVTLKEGQTKVITIRAIR